MKRKKRKHSRRLQAPATPLYQPLTDSEARSMKEEIKRDFRKSKVFGDKGPVLLETGAEKMSEILLDFARPFLNKYDTGPGMSEKIIGLAVIGWNMALVPPGEKQALINSVLRMIPASQRSTAEELLCIMEKRKQEHFNEIKRYIANFKVSESADSFNVFVASTPSPDQMTELVKNSGKVTSLISEAEEPGGTPTEHKTASPQEKVPAIGQSGIFRSMLSKLIAYCMHRRRKR